MSGKNPNLTINEVAKRYNYSVDDLRVMADKIPLPHIKQYPAPGQIFYLFPADELARKLQPRPIEVVAPPVKEKMEEEPVATIYPKPKPVETKAPAPKEEPVKPTATKKTSAKKSTK